MTSFPPPPSDHRASGVTSSSDCHPALDPAVQTFLDRLSEGATTRPRAASSPLAPDDVLLPASRPFKALPVLVYLYDPATSGRNDALHAIACRSGAAVLPHPIVPGAGPHAVENDLLETLNLFSVAAADKGIDLARLAIGGDGLGALAAIAFASRSRTAPYRPDLLVLTTPILGPPAHDCSTAWLSASEARDRGLAGERLAGDAGWPSRYARDRLLRLPATILLTAEVDPFRDVAESFARRLMAAEIEVSASRNLGTIHDFAWLPDLLHARGTIDAHCIIANAIRERLAP